MKPQLELFHVYSPKLIINCWLVVDDGYRSNETCRSNCYHLFEYQFYLPLHSSTIKLIVVMMIWIISENDIIRTIQIKNSFHLSIRSQLQEMNCIDLFRLKVEYAIE